MKLNAKCPAAGLAAMVALSVASAAGAAASGSDFDWVVIGAPGNPAYSGPDLNEGTVGRGSVDYEFRMSRLEVTTGQWLEFINIFGPQGDPHFMGRSTWGGFERDLSYSGPGFRWRLRDVPHAEMQPVVRMGWRNAARFVNWLHNDKAPTPEALETGAYDTSTFGQSPDQPGLFTDAPTRLPGAKFWIPSFDEWIKAVHYDPNRYGVGEGGWWMYPNGTDEPLTPGPAGVGQTNAGYLDYQDYESMRLGAYPETTTPWGLLDASGGASEWMEDWLSPIYTSFRYYNGAPRGDLFGDSFTIDPVYRHGAAVPLETVALLHLGLRVASVIPSPGAVAIFVVCCAFRAGCRRR